MYSNLIINQKELKVNICKRLHLGMRSFNKGDRFFQYKYMEQRFEIVDFGKELLWKGPK